MKRMSRWAVALLLLTVLQSQLSAGFAQGTAFIYQGRLNVGGSPADGRYDYRFKLYADPLGNTQVGSSYVTNAIPVASGLFITTIDFGAGIFTGGTNWLEVDVRTNNAPSYTASYTVLNPFQEVTPTPNAIFAESAANLSGVLPAAQLTGSVPSGSFSGTYRNAVSLTNSGNVFNGSFTGDGSALSHINALALNGLNATNFWQTGGNAGTTAGQNYLGTLDNQPLELHVGGIRGLRLEPDVTGGDAPNVIGGSPINYINPGVDGSVIGGGGDVDPYIIGAAFSNSIYDSYCVIGGGLQNTIQYGSDTSFIGGGNDNLIQSNSSSSTIAGGELNSIQGNAHDSFVGGGRVNTIQSAAYQSTIAGGYLNTIQTSAYNSTIGGGSRNVVQNDAYASVIGGGAQNTIQTGASLSAIAGGSNNTIQAGANLSTIGGGYINIIQSNSAFSTIGGGYDNTIQTNCSYATINGGFANTIQAYSGWSSIGGGIQNTIQADSYYGTVGGGFGNTIQAGASYSTISGGYFNIIQTNAVFATIAGGLNNTVGGSFSFAAGLNSTASSNNTFVWSDGSDSTISTTTNQFMVRASGGTIIYSSTGTAAGVSLAAGSGSWANLSDRNCKDHLTPVALADVLKKVSVLPISEWSYKTEEGVTHIGPMAQDFYAAFRIGEDERHISSVDEEGVALAAIQGLDQKLNEKDATIQEQAGEIAELKQSMAELKQLVQTLAEKK